MPKSSSGLIPPFCSFLDKCLSPYHEKQELLQNYQEQGFTLLSSDAWSIENGGKYLFTQKGFVAAFTIPEREVQHLHILASHMDSPCFKLRSILPLSQEKPLQFSPYGSPVISSWLNRDLYLAGAIVTKNKEGIRQSHLLTIPFAFSISGASAHGQSAEKESKNLASFTLNDLSYAQLVSYIESRFPEEILLSWDLRLAPAEKSALLGVKSQQLASKFLDNLSSVHACYIASIQAPINRSLNLTLFLDHEEIGSPSSEGALSTLIENILENLRIHLHWKCEKLFGLKRKGMVLSVDVAHAFNPLYPDSFDAERTPFLGKGVCIKEEPSHKYATDMHTFAFIHEHTKELSLPLQLYMPSLHQKSGSTVGPLLSRTLGMNSVDIGVPLLSMHSSRELIHTQDQEQLTTLLTHLLSL